MAESTAPDELGELNELKKILELSIADSDTKNFQKTVETFSDQFKDVLGPEQLDNLQKLLANMKRTQRPTATYHEFVLFFVVIGILASIFGNKYLTIFKLLRSERNIFIYKNINLPEKLN